MGFTSPCCHRSITDRYLASHSDMGGQKEQTRRECAQAGCYCPPIQKGGKSQVIYAYPRTSCVLEGDHFGISVTTPFALKNTCGDKWQRIRGTPQTKVFRRSRFGPNWSKSVTVPDPSQQAKVTIFYGCWFSFCLGMGGKLIQNCHNFMFFKKVNTVVKA